MTKNQFTFIVGFILLSIFFTLLNFSPKKLGRASFLFSIPPVFAVGLQVKPSEIKLEDVAREKISTHLQVFNPSPEVAVFDVYPDSFESQIKTSPASFILESGESREVVVSFNFPEAGQFQTDLSVIARPLSKNSFNAGGGVKIPVSVSISQNKNNLFASIFTFFGQNQSSLVGFLAFITIIILIVLSAKLFLKKKIT